MSSNIKKNIFNALFIIVLFICTFYYIFKDHSFTQVIQYIHESNKLYVSLAGIMVLLFVCSESVIIHYMMNGMSKRVKLKSCIKYSFIGFFVSFVTPSASGGQPAQMYYMNQDGISVAQSSLILMVVTIVYKAVLVIMAGFMLLTNYNFVMFHVKGIKVVLIFGVLMDLFIVALLIFIIYKQSFAKKLLVAPIIWLGKKKIIRNYEKWTKKVLGVVNKYAFGAEYLREHKLMVFKVFLLTAFQRICYFLITYFVYKSFGLSGTSAYEILILQTMLAISVDCLPLPGGMGASESIFIEFFKDIFIKGDISLVLPGMVLSRGISFYAIIILGGLITCFAHLTRKKARGNLA